MRKGILAASAVFIVLIFTAESGKAQTATSKQLLVPTTSAIKASCLSCPRSIAGIPVIPSSATGGTINPAPAQAKKEKNTKKSGSKK